MRFRAVLLVALLGSASIARPAFAQPSASQIEASKKVAADHANRAFEAYQSGKYADAVAGFQAAEAAFHAPKFLLYIARSQSKLGKLTAAKGTYESVAKEQLPAYAPTEFFSAQADARKELIELLPRIPTLRIQGAPGITKLTLDGQPARLGEPLAVDPGEHTIVGTGGGEPEVRTKITLQERQTETVTLERPAASPGASVAAAPPVTPSPEEPPRRIPTAAYVAYGAGALGLLAGALFGGLTLAKKGEHEALLRASPVAAREANDVAAQGRTFAVAADVGFATALAGAAAGTIVWVVSSREPGAATPGRSVLVAPRAGGVAVGGTF